MAEDRDLEGRTYVVTGANTGIGKATTEGLARRGGHVILATRSLEKTQPVIDELRASTGNDRLEHLPLDLTDLAEVRTAARTLLDRGEPIDVLVDNAGVAGPRGETAQGFELAFGVNHLGHFLFTTQLLPLLQEGGGRGEDGGPVRVVVVSSQSHYDAKDLHEEHLTRRTKSVTGLPEYARSKLANVLFAQELARRVPADQVVTASLHPGVIASDIWRRVPRLVRPLMTRFMKSTEEGAQTSLHCATSAEVGAQSGGYYDDCALKEPSPLATPELAAWLWKRSEEWTAA